MPLADHISSLLAYWWIGLGMIAVMVFLIYNSFLAIAVLPRSQYNPLKTISTKKPTENKSYENLNTLNIHMHVFVASYDEFNSYDYMPYVKALAKKYPNFKYNFVVVLNDVIQDTVSDFSDEQKNDMALNLLLANGNIMDKNKPYENPTLKFISLTKYMDNSPVKKNWRLLPYHFLSFLVRCIAIWDKGGVSFNPLILTPNSLSSVYFEKLYSVLGNIQSKNKLMPTKKRKLTRKTKKTFNNIRDIINDLENGETNANVITDSLTEAENIESVTITPLEETKNVDLILIDHPILPEQKDEFLHKNHSNKRPNTKLSRNILETVNVMNSTTARGIAANILPKFLESLFHSNSKNLTSNMHLHEKNDTTSKVDPIVNDLIGKIAPELSNKTSSGNENTKVIIDLKGNLIATEIGCHAFIGTVFNNVQHYTYEKSVSDFIISELSLFCRGNLSICNNVEVLLL
ncbi:jg20634 [Pararge aegeria aegeria]|uniref:Jg20634 protein n=1 Tax=Pararge aegeria aegeria TaxID=348720 RepID=A0A8S4REY1_9NEOP|nr:jg20634 [Pararge aegeria aegeria]